MFTSYGHWRSLAAMRAQIALGLKGLPYAKTQIDLLNGEQFTPDNAAVNPQPAVPALRVDDGPPLFQSMANLEWLGETYPAALTAAMVAAEAHIARDPHSGGWTHGDVPGMADTSLYSLQASHEQRGGSFDGLPQLARIVARCAADERFAAAYPLRQPGSPGP